MINKGPANERYRRPEPPILVTPPPRAVYSE